MADAGVVGADAGVDGARGRFRLYQPKDAYAALGMAVSHLMNKPAFAKLRFGSWSQVLVGQINRGHFAFVLDQDNRVQGFVGWTVATKEKADLWLDQDRELSNRELGNDGAGARECLVINAWSANSDGVTRFMLEESRRRGRGINYVYYKRYYENGTIRRVRLRVDGRHAGAPGGGIGDHASQVLHAPA